MSQQIDPIVIFGTLTTIFSLMISFWAVPVQIIKNYKENKNGLNTAMVYFFLGLPVSRIIYSYLISAWFVLIPDLLGIAGSIILFIQTFRPRIWKVEA